MASIFQPTLSEPQGVERPVAAVQDNTTAQIVQALGQGLEVAAGVKDRNTLAEVGNKLDDISQSEAEFRETQSALESQILTTKDKQVLDSVNQQLIKLERGEMSGRLTPSATQARKNVLLRQQISDNPWLAADIKALNSARSAGTGTIQRTPEEKALDKLREEAVSHGTSLSTTISAANRTFELTRRNSEIAASVEEGKANFPLFREGMSNSVELARGSFLSSLFRAVEENPESIDETTWEPVLENMERELRSLAIRTQSEAAQRGVTFSIAQQDQLDQDIKEQVGALRAIVTGKDALNQVKRHREFIENNGIKAMTAMNAMVGTSMALGMDGTAQKLMYDILPKAIASVNKSGSMDDLNLLAAAGDPDAQMAVMMLEFHANMIKSLPVKVSNGFNPSDGPAVQSMVNLFAASALKAGNPGNNGPVGVQAQDAAKTLLDLGQDPRELRWFLDNDIQRTTLDTPAIYKGLSNRLDQLDTSLTTQVPEALHPEVTQIQREGRKEVGREVKRTSLGTVEFDSASDTFVLKEARARAARTPAPKQKELRDLNMSYQIRKKYNMFDASRTQWVEEILGKLNAVPELSSASQIENVESQTKTRKVTRNEDGSLSLGDQ